MTPNPNRLLEPYIHTQRLHLLKRDSFSSASTALNSTEYFSDAHNATTKYWTTIANDAHISAVDVVMTQFLQPTSPNCLCIVSEAGMGKTIALHRAQVFISQTRCNLGFLVPLVRIGDMHINACNADDVIACIRVCILKTLDEAKAGSNFTTSSFNDQMRYVKNKCQAREVVLLLDGLDHSQYLSPPAGRPSADTRSPADSRISAIRDFLDVYGSSMKVIISARPSALGHHWDALGLDDRCLIAQMAYFDKEDQVKFLGTECFNHLQQLDTDFLRIPRALSTVRREFQTDSKALCALKSSSDVYFKSIEGLFLDGFKGLRDNMGYPKAVKVFSVIGYQMALTDCDSVTSNDLPAFLASAWVNYQPTLMKENTLGDDFADDISFREHVTQLQKYNEGWAHSVFEKGGVNNGLVWRDKTLRDFFAALWLLVYPNSKTWKQLWDSGPGSGASYQNRLKRDLGRADNWYWIWRFVIEADVDYPVPWLKPRRNQLINWLGEIIELTTPTGNSFNGSEWTYRAYRQLERQATSSASQEAVTMLDKFQAPFAELVQNGNAVASGLLSGFVRIPFLNCWMRDFPITNREYRLFSPNHTCSNDKLDCPAINVSYYDAMAFCHWISSDFLANQAGTPRWRFTLPTHDQWANACNADGLKWYGKTPARLLVDLKKLGYCCGSEDCYRQKCDIKGQVGLSYKDMRGNVWEWVQDYDTKDRAKRMAFGGGWGETNATSYLAELEYGKPFNAAQERDDLGFRPVGYQLTQP